MLRVIVASPYAGEVERNTKYARAAMVDSLHRGEAPFATHLLYPQVLNDADKRERERGIQAAFEWLHACDFVAFYIDYGWSPGMLKELKIARLLFKRVALRHIYPFDPLGPLVGTDVQDELNRSRDAGLLWKEKSSD